MLLVGASQTSSSVLSARDVAVAWGPKQYPPSPPFSPTVPPPEYPFGNAGEGPVLRSDGSSDEVYHTVRDALRLLGLDKERFGSAQWNPLGDLVRPGDTVVLKPNFVRDFRETQSGHADCLITHGSIIRTVLDYVFIALGGKGSVTIADAPHNDADFQAIRRIAGLDEIQDFYRREADFDVRVYDLRPEQARKIDGVIVGHEALPGDPAGYVKVNLGLNSAFAEVNHLCHLLYGSEYDTRELHSHHHDDVHEYLISKTILDADVVIGLPKLKTHKKVGLTVNLKNLVGINGNKNWLPHHREGTPSQNGDQFSDDSVKRRVERSTVMQFKKLFPLLGPLRPLIAGPIKNLGKRIFGDTNTNTIRSGNWYGNDTTWRMVLDLNRILLYADADGRLRETPVRRFFSVVDGIVAGEGNGPLDPTPRPAGLVLAGTDPVAVDHVCARLMAFDFRKIAVLLRASEPHRYPISKVATGDVRCVSNRAEFSGALERLNPLAPPFSPHFGWRGNIELTASTNRRARSMTGSPGADCD